MKIDLWPVMYFPGVDTGIAGSSDIISCKMKAQDKKRSVFSVLDKDKEAGEERSM